ncbi:hypothetical protein CDO73_18375 [Saccharibacillus sp. O23]|uniref:recombinase family protein n=1 Tax=Saccharibacillus sp. O23 TaxID=2009338 RepID=UPI000B4DFC70|nr:recombinase family protein [Saccharibacillus sp. O23]OWR28514.1 hypothetical protein CDO73_18375 [Saccharibacillus sp. O23]
MYELGEQEEVELVRQIFQMAAAGHGGKRIAGKLNRQSIIAEKRWSPSTVLSILANQVYIGQRVWNKKKNADGKCNEVSEWAIAEYAHPAIVDQKLWDAAQFSLMQRKQRKTK